MRLYDDFEFTDTSFETYVYEMFINYCKRFLTS
jgi:hypothetical protein